MMTFLQILIFSSGFLDAHLSFLLLRVLQVQCTQLQLDVSGRVRLTLGPVLVTAVGRRVGLQFGQQLLTTAKRQPATVKLR